MKRSKKCPKCESTNLIENAKVLDRGTFNMPFAMSVATFRDPGMAVVDEKRTSKVSAWVCAACGFLELYADAPKSLTI